MLTATDAAGKVWRNAYNAAGQLIYATNPLNQTRFWEYDAQGRMTRATVPVAVAHASVVYGTTNVSAATAQSWNYTAACSGVTAPANTNLPISVTDSQGYVLCYEYDAFDRVTKVKYLDGTTDQYSYAFPAGWTANGINYGGTQSLDVWQVTDRQGRVRDLVDATTGARIGALDYKPYGAIKATDGIQPDYQYAGLLWVPEVGLNASATRFYDPGTTRWMTRDWIREEGGINGYGYVHGNPVRWTDPMGTFVADEWLYPNCMPNAAIEATATAISVGGAAAAVGGMQALPLGFISGYVGGYVNALVTSSSSNPILGEVMGGVVQSVGSVPGGIPHVAKDVASTLISGPAKGATSGIEAPDNVYVNAFSVGVAATSIQTVLTPSQPRTIGKLAATAMFFEALATAAKNKLMECSCKK